MDSLPRGNAVKDPLRAPGEAGEHAIELPLLLLLLSGFFCTSSHLFAPLCYSRAEQGLGDFILAPAVMLTFPWDLLKTVSLAAAF